KARVRKMERAGRRRIHPSLLFLIRPAMKKVPAILSAWNPCGTAAPGLCSACTREGAFTTNDSNIGLFGLGGRLPEFIALDLARGRFGKLGNEFKSLRALVGRKTFADMLAE